MIYLLGLWLVIEGTAQLARLGVVKTWRFRDLPGRRGITLHPLCILYDDPAILAHERVHAGQMARYSWLGFLLLYGLSGRWRVRLECEAYARTTRDSPTYLARRVRTDTYFPAWLAWQDPGHGVAIQEARRWTNS